MRVALVVNGIFTLGGSAVVASGLAIELKRRGIDVVVVSHSVKRSHTEADLMLHRGIDVRLISESDDENTFIKKMPSLIGTLRALRPDVIHLHGTISIAYLAAIVRILTRKPVVVTVTRVWTRTLLLSTPGSMSHGPGLLTRMKVSFLSVIDHAICQSSLVSRSLVAIGFPRRKVSTIPYGVKHSLSQKAPAVNLTPLGRHDGAQYVLFFGDCSADRGVDYLLDAVERVLRSNVQAEFVLAYRYANSDGRGGARGIPDLLLLRESLRLQATTKRVHVLGPSATGDYGFPLSDLIESCHVLVLPFFVAPMNPPLSLVESMAAGKALVLSPLLAKEDLVIDEENALVSELSGEALANKILQLLDDSDLRSRLADNAKRTVTKSWNWNANMEKIMHVYEACLNAAPDGHVEV